MKVLSPFKSPSGKHKLNQQMGSCIFSCNGKKKSLSSLMWNKRYFAIFEEEIVIYKYRDNFLNNDALSRRIPLINCTLKDEPCVNSNLIINFSVAVEKK